MKSLLLLLILSLSSMALAVEPLHSGDYRQHVDAHSRPLLVILWSVDCPPCHDELAALGALQNDFPNMPVMIINTDSHLPSEQVDVVLGQHGIADLQHFQFADPVPARQRREIDPQWYGELPRSYLMETDKTTPHSGAVSESALRGWLTTLPSASHQF